MKNRKYSLTEENVLAILQIKGPMNHKMIMKFIDCTYYGLDAILRKLCKAGKVHHEDIFTKKGFKNSHLFMRI